MRIGLPDDHGLSADIAETLLFRENGNPSLTDAQFEALALGLGHAGYASRVIVADPLNQARIDYPRMRCALGPSCLRLR